MSIFSLKALSRHRAFLNFTRLMAFSALFSPSLCHATHPLISDDTGIQGQGHYQLEINTDRSRDTDDGIRIKADVINFTLTYGWTDTLDIAVNLPYQRVAQDNEPSYTGPGDVSLFMKWRFYDRNGFSLALKPVVLLASGDESKGLGNGRVGYGLNTLATFVTGRLTLIGTLGISRNNNDVGAKKELWNISGAVMYGLTPTVRGVLDVGTNRNINSSTDMNPAFAILGLIYSPNEKLDLDAGYKKGLNESEVDSSWGLGLTYRW